MNDKDDRLGKSCIILETEKKITNYFQVMGWVSFCYSKVDEQNTEVLFFLNFINTF